MAQPRTNAGPCRLPACDKPQHVKNLCRAHYHRLRRYGDPTAGAFRQFADAEDAWLTYAQPTSHGLEWAGPRGGRGQQYGVMPPVAHRAYAHRYAWERAYGPIPEGMEIDHPPGCPKTCVTVEHLALLTKSEHSSLGIERGEKGPQFARRPT